MYMHVTLEPLHEQDEPVEESKSPPPSKPKLDEKDISSVEKKE